MAIRWRVDGRLVCAAKTQPETDDTYIDDRLHFQLSVISRAIIPDRDEATNGLWHWVHGYDLLYAEPRVHGYDLLYAEPRRKAT